MSDIPGWAWQRAYKKHLREIATILKYDGKSDWIEAQKYTIKELRAEARRIAGDERISNGS